MNGCKFFLEKDKKTLAFFEDYAIIKVQFMGIWLSW